LAQKRNKKKIRRGHYSSNNFQDSTKRKITKKKTLGYLPRVLFFNAFELGAVILKDAHVSTGKELGAREHQKTNMKHFKSKPLPMKKNFVKKQVMRAQSKKHRKAKQLQLQDFQHKEGKLNIIEIYKTMLPSLIITFSSIMNKINNITIT
jgi:hypothetical protein